MPSIYILHDLFGVNIAMYMWRFHDQDVIQKICKFVA